MRTLGQVDRGVCWVHMCRVEDAPGRMEVFAVGLCAGMRLGVRCTGRRVCVVRGAIVWATWLASVWPASRLH